MRFLWADDRCIICLSQSKLTDEHIIPDCLGGKLKVKFLCSDCNRRFGQRIVAAVKSDPRFCLAINAVAKQLPDSVRQKLVEGQSLVADTTTGPLRATVKKGRSRIRSTELADGSVILNGQETSRMVNKSVGRDQAKPEEIAEALRRLDEMSPGEPTPFTDQMSITKLGIHGLRPALDGPFIGEILPLLIAYEFLALHLVSDIYATRFDPIRAYLLHAGELPISCKVEGRLSHCYGPWHGLALTQANPHAVVQIRFFDFRAYLVHFCDLSWAGQRLLYHCDLAAGEEGLWPIPETPVPGSRA